MKFILRVIKRYTFLLFIFAKNSLIAQLEFRINFISGVAVEAGYFLAKLVYVIVIYQTGVIINGMTPDSIVMFIGTYVMMTGIYMAFFSNFCNISNYVKEGTLDMFITKPVSLQFITTLRYIDFAMPIPNLLGGLILLCIGWKNTNTPVNPINIIVFIGFMVSGIIITYAIFLIPKLLSFWWVSTNGISQITDACWDFNNMPMGIYNQWIQRAGTFAIPLFLITNYSPLYVLNRLNKLEILWGILAPIIFMIISRIVWNLAIKNYTSASS